MLKITFVLLFLVSSLGFAKQKKNRPKLKCPKKEYKTLLCHKPPGNKANTKQLAVDPSDVEDHLSHGDSLGWCEGTEYEAMKELCGICDVDIDPNCN